MKQRIFCLLAIGIFAGFFLTEIYSQHLSPTMNASAQDAPPLTPTPTENSFSSGQSSTLTPTPTREITNPFEYTPLPATSPSHDIIETIPLTASRTSAQIDDSITFTVTIKNQASYNKRLYNLCFESTDGNFGCIFSINLAPGQTYSVQNVGTWVHPGTKHVWITWSQDNVNYYQPVNATTDSITILV